MNDRRNYKQPPQIDWFLVAVILLLVAWLVFVQRHLP